MEGEQAFVQQMCIFASAGTNTANAGEKAIGLMAQSLGASRSNVKEKEVYIQAATRNLKSDDPFGFSTFLKGRGQIGQVWFW